MFETSVVREHAAAGRGRLLTASLTLHTLAVVAIVLATVSSVRFPSEAPRAMVIFSSAEPVRLPPPLGSPEGRRADPAPVRRVATPVTPRETVTAPQEVPSNIPQIEQNGAASTLVADAGSGGSGSNDLPFGDPNGDPNAVDVGQGVGSGGGGTVPEMTFTPGGEVRGAVVLRRVEPDYPRAALAARVSGIVVLRCVIDKRGEIRDLEVVRSSFGAFEAPAVAALRQWRFAPGSFRGQAVDTWFELTIRFSPR